MPLIIDNGDSNEILNLETQFRDRVHYLQNEKKEQIQAVRYLCSDPDRTNSFGNGDWMAQSKYLREHL